MNPQEPTLEDSIAQVMQTLPAPLRRYLGEGKYTPVAQRLMGRYGLRIDQGGVLERELMLLLLGIENPDEFASALKTEAVIAEDVVLRILTDLNQEVFVPLQAQIRGEGASTAAPAPQAPVAPRLVPPAPQYIAQPPPQPRPQPVEPQTPRPQVAPPIPPQPQAPAPRVYPPTPPPRPVASAPLPPKTVLPGQARPASPSVAPRVVPLPANLPGTPPINRLEGRTLPPQTRPSPGQSPASQPAPKYSVDPYRELPDAK